MARTRYGWRTLPTAIAVALALQGCGASSDRTDVRASVRAYVTAIAAHDVAAACAVVTPAYWSAWAAQVNGDRAHDSAAALPRSSCRRGLKRMFSQTTRRSARASTFTLTDVRIDGAVATAHLALGPHTHGSGSARAARFTRAPDGVWRIDCCAGAQVTRPSWTIYWIPSESMEPTVKMGQRVTADNTAPRSHPPALDDIVVFHPPAGAEPDEPVCGSWTEGQGHARPCGVPIPAESGATFIKRVVGVPGDRIAMIAGHVIRNGVREQDPYTLPCLSIDAAECTFRKPIIVGPGEYYLLGDNRGASDDSRFWGPVKRSWIIGVVTRLSR